MKVLHLVTGLAKASGVTTFVEGVCGALNEIGVEACATTMLPDTFEDCTMPGIVHLHGLWSPFYHNAVAWAKTAGIPIVWSTHGMLAPWSMRHKWWKKIPAWLLYQKRDLKYAAVMHATVEAEAEWIRNLGFKQPIVIAPLGTTLPNRANVSDTLVRSHRTLLFVGRVYPVKALDNLIKAFAAANVPGWRLRIVGPDQAGHMGELMQLCEKLGLSYSDQEENIHSTTTTSNYNSQPQVEFAGPKFDDELAAEYENCDCLALVSHTENFGATVVDAMAHGKPVITSTNTPWMEVADLGCGYWVDNDVKTLSKAIGAMMRLSDAERAEMGMRGIKLVEDKYTWHAVAKTMAKAYEGICS